jgi:iron(III) transport system permease protein
VLPLGPAGAGAGGLLVCLEVLSDFATVQYFGVDTLSVGIYRVWRGQFDRPAASVLALLVLLLALALLAAERWLRRGARYSSPLRSTTPVAPVQLSGWRAWAACGACTLVLLVAVGVPLVTLACGRRPRRCRGRAAASTRHSSPPRRTACCSRRRQRPRSWRCRSCSCTPSGWTDGGGSRSG